MLTRAFEIGIHPDEFWDMTPHEFMLCNEGYARRERTDMQKRAWEVAHSVNMWTKDPVSPAELLGEKKQAGVIFTSVEEWQAHMRKKRELREREQLRQARAAKREKEAARVGK